MEYAELHAHSAYSIADSAVSVEQLVKKAKELGHRAIALTDHGQAHGIIEFADACKKHEIKGIIGCEFYVEGILSKKPFHFLVWVKNKRGWHNFIKLLTFGNENFYYRPIITIEALSSHSDGLAASSACLGSEIAQLILAGRIDDAKNAALKYQEIFGQGNFFLELHDHGIPHQTPVNKGLVSIHKETSIPLIAANDVHYVCPDDFVVQKAVVAIGRKETLEQYEQEDGEQYYTQNHYLKSPKEMGHLFAHYPDALKNTLRVAEMCEFVFENQQVYFPVLKLPEGHTISSYLLHKLEKGIMRRFPQGLTQAEQERIRYEYNIIKNLGYEAYFLIVADLVDFAKANGILVADGRGSAVSSMITYCLGITNVYPLPDLLFERFLNPSRISLPDIDIDFDYRGRDKVIQYIYDTYGRDKVSQIIAFGTFGARVAVKDVARILGHPPSVGTKIANAIPGKPANIKLKDALAMPALAQLYNENDDVKAIVDLAQRLEGLPRHKQIHAAGVVITPEPMKNFSPICRVPRDKGEYVFVSMFDKDKIERMGLLKMDILGNRNLTVVKDTIESVLQDSSERQKLFRLCRITEDDLPKNTKAWAQIIKESIPMDDPDTYNLLQTGSYDGIFQLEASDGIRRLTRQVKPRTLEDVSTVLALYRPGPIGSNQHEEYLMRRNNLKSPSYIHPSVESILEPTQGVMAYQEQIMQMAMVLAGYTASESDELRSAMAKKDEKLINKHRKMFVGGCVKKGTLAEGVAEELYNQIEHFGHYAFNKSHSKAYAKLTVQTAFLKCHFPLQFMTALLNSVVSAAKGGRTARYLKECKEIGIDVLPINVNHSGIFHQIEGNAIRLGMIVVKGLGEDVAHTIVSARNGGTFADVHDFFKKMVENAQNQDRSPIPPNAVEALVKAGAFDTLHSNRAGIISTFPTIVENAIKANRRRNDPQMSLFDIEDVVVKIPDSPKWTHDEELRGEVEALGFFLTGNPLEAYSSLQTDIIASPNLARLGDKKKVRVGGFVKDIRLHQDRKDRTMAFVEMQDFFGDIELICFARQYEEFGSLLTPGAVLIVEGRLSIDGDVESDENEEDVKVKVLVDYIEEATKD